MTQPVDKSRKSGDMTPAIAPLRTLAELGDKGTGRCAEMDLTPRWPFPVHPDWYERYWYGDQSPSRWGILVNTVWRLCSEVPRAAETIRRRSARTIKWRHSAHA
jgi:hypothetical protein